MGSFCLLHIILFCTLLVLKVGLHLLRETYARRALNIILPNITNYCFSKCSAYFIKLKVNYRFRKIKKIVVATQDRE